MIYKSKKKLRKLSNRQIQEDIKRFIKYSHSFYEKKVPEMEVLAKKLHEEYSLKEFYRIFNKMWNSGYHSEKSLAIYSFQLYKNDYDFETWKFLKPKLKEIKSLDKADIVSINIIGEIHLKIKKMEKEILKLGNARNIWLKRMALMSLIPLIKNNDIEFPIKIVKINIEDKNKLIQEANGLVLKEIADKKPSIGKKFILKNIHMPLVSFEIATENMKELKKLRDIKKLDANKKNRLLFWKKI